MALLDLLLDEHRRLMHRMIDIYAELPIEKWAEALPNVNAYPWLPDEMTLTELFERNCGFGEPWIHMLDGEPESENDGSPEGLREQLDENHRRLGNLIRRIEAEGAWDLTFVDPECEPPQVFSFGSVIEMQITYTAHSRVSLEMHLRKLGHPVTFED